jgi:hypothetical protein
LPLGTRPQSGKRPNRAKGHPEILIAISIAILAARFYRSASCLFASVCAASTWRLTLSALPAAELQMSRILCAASMSPIGHSISSSQISFGLLLENHRIATPLGDDVKA